MTTEEKIAELETNCKAMTDEIEKLKAELAKKDKNETVWIPEIYNTYMCIDSFGHVYSTILEDMSSEKQRIDFNNVYQSNNKTQTHLEWYRDNVLKIQNKLMQLHELLCPDYFPDWENNNESKFYLYYNYDNNTWNWDSWAIYCDCVVYFTGAAAEKACEILNREKFMMEST